MRSSQPVPDIWRRLLPVLLVPAVVLLFVGGPSWFDLPSLRYLWNMGHLALFAIVTLLWHNHRPLQTSLQLWRFLAIIVLISLGIEGLQLLVGRSFSLMDVLRNLIGAWLALLFSNRKMIPWLLSSVLGGALLLDLSGLLSTAWLDWQLQSRAPIIENFEQPLAQRRWSHQFQLNDRLVREGEFSAAVSFQPARYSTFRLYYPLSDWRGYRFFQFSIYSPFEEPAQMTLRIHDREHQRSGEFQHQDRFNIGLTLNPGWNDVSIPMSQIEQSPAERAMDMGHIVEVQWFMSRLTEQKTFLFDDIRLSH